MCNKCCNEDNKVANSSLIINSNEPGADGLSNYQIAVLNGFVGTELEYLESLKGGVYIPITSNNLFNI